MKSMNIKKARLSFVIGLAASSLIMGSAAQASNELPAGAFLVAKRSADEGERSERSDDRRNSSGSRSSSSRDGDGKGYGYGYERRQRGGDASNDARDTSRGGRDDRREQGNERSSKSGRG